MANETKRARKLCTKLKPLYAAMLPLMLLGVSNPIQAAVIDFANGSNMAGGIVLTDNTTQLQVNVGSAEQSGVISGAFAIEKIGVGILTLSGTNTYVGSTTISAGTISIAADNNLGTSGTRILDGGTLQTTTSFSTSRTTTLNAGGGTFNTDAATTLTHSGRITGSGDLTKTGDGTLRLTSTANSYSGNTLVSQGTLRLISSTIPDIGNITNNAIVEVNRGSGGANYFGVMSGSGSLLKTGAGSVGTNQDHTYTGGTTISAGSLRIGFGGTTGSIVGNVVNNGELSIIRSNAYTFAGDISGSGSVNKSGSGTTTLSGTNTYTGGTMVSFGTLQGTTTSLQGNIVNTANVTFDQTTTGTYAGVISSTGSVTKANTGSVNLTGVNTYNGATTVNAGTLFVNGSISNSTSTVNAGGTLGGTGTVGTVNINGGTFAPGNSIGTTNVAGNVDFTGGGNYNVEVNAAGASDLINATGSATLTSGVVNVQPEAGTYNVSTDYTILTAAGGLGGTTFASVNSNLAFLTPTLTYDATNVFLNLTRNDVSFSDVANTPNQKAVSTVLGNNTTALQTIVNNIIPLSTTNAQQAFDTLSGVQHTHVQVITKGLSQQFLNLLFNRGNQDSGTSIAFNSLQNFDPMSDQLFADNSASLPASYSGDTTYNTNLERGWWLQGFGGFGDIDDTSNASGADYDTQGLAFGVDTEWRDFVVGLAGSYASSDADTFGGSLDIDSFQAATYVNWQRDANYLTGALGFGLHDTDASRTVIVGTSTSTTATADYNSYNISVSVETGKEIALSLNTSLTPFAGVEYSHNNRDSFTEAGAATANLSVNDEDQDSLRTKFGLRLSHELSTQQGRRITPEASIAYVREMMDNVSRVDAAFTAVPTSTFQVDGSALDRDRLQISFGVTGHINETTAFNVGYNGELAGSDDNHSFAATLRMVW